MNCSKCGGRMKIGTSQDTGSPDGIDVYLSYGHCKECGTTEFFKERIVSHHTAKQETDPCLDFWATKLHDLAIEIDNDIMNNAINYEDIWDELRKYIADSLSANGKLLAHFETYKDYNKFHPYSRMEAGFNVYKRLLNRMNELEGVNNESSRG